MAIQTRSSKVGTKYRAYWRNPMTTLLEYGPWTAEKAEASRLDSLVKHRLRHDRDSFRPVEVPSEGQKVTVADVLMLYVERGPMEESTRKEAFYHSRQIAKRIGTCPAGDVDRVTVVGMEDDMRRTVAQSTIQNRVAVLRQALGWAADRGIIKANPIADYRSRKGKRLQILPPTPEEAGAIIAAASPHVVRAVIIGFNLGVRMGASELFRLTWDRLFIRQDGSLEFRVPNAKKGIGDEDRMVPVKSDLVPVVLAWRESDLAAGIGHVIHYRGQPIRSSMANAWKATLERAGITRRIRLYDMRHAFVTEAIAAGADPKAVSTLAGHRNLQTTLAVYQRSRPEQRREAVEALPFLAYKPGIQGAAGKAFSGRVGQKNINDNG